MHALVAVIGQGELVNAEASDSEEAVETVVRLGKVLGNLRNGLEVLEVDNAGVHLARLLAALVRRILPLAEDPAESVLVVLRRARELARLNVPDRSVRRALLRAENRDLGTVRVERARNREADAVRACKSKSVAD